MTTAPTATTTTTGSVGTDSVSITVREDSSAGNKITLLIDGERVSVSRSKLAKHSLFFRERFEDGPSVNVLDIDYVYPGLLVRLLNCLDGPYTDLWGEFDITNKDKYVELMKAVAFYRFDEIPPIFLRELVESSGFNANEMCECLNAIYTHTPGCFNDEFFFSYCFDRLQSFSKDPSSANELYLWLKFVVKKNLAVPLSEYRGWLDAYSGDYPPHVVVALVLKRKHFERIMPRVSKQVRRELNHPGNAPLAYYAQHKKFINWCVTMMQDSSTQFVTTKNFRLLWENSEWMQYSDVKSALLAFARDKEHKNGVIKLWPYAMPDDLVAGLMGD